MPIEERFQRYMLVPLRASTTLRWKLENFIRIYKGTPEETKAVELVKAWAKSEIERRYK